MDRAAKFCLVSFVLLALMTSQAGGTNTQGFYWGLKSGDRLDYVLTTHSNTSSYVLWLNERIHMIVNDLPQLPDMATSALEVMSNNATAYWANGSVIAYNGMAIGISYLTVVAVGNWPLLADLLFADFSPLYEVVDDSSVWEIRGGDTMGSIQDNVSLLFSKSDGATYQNSVLTSDVTTDAETLHTEVNRLAVGVSTPVLLSAAIISAQITVTVLVIRRYHR